MLHRRVKAGISWINGLAAWIQNLRCSYLSLKAKQRQDFKYSQNSQEFRTLKWAAVTSLEHPWLKMGRIKTWEKFPIFEISSITYHIRQKKYFKGTQGEYRSLVSVVETYFSGSTYLPRENNRFASCIQVWRCWTGKPEISQILLLVH